MGRVFITGGTGCIGATTVHHLFEQYGGQVDQVLIATRSSETALLKIWLSDRLDELVSQQRIQFASVDLGDATAMNQTLVDFGPSHVIHLGALQSPDCAADPQLGLDVNLGGTLKLLDVIAGLPEKLERFVFASSAAVYGKRSFYPADMVAENMQLAPPNLYGVWKVAGEHLSALFQERTGVPTVCLRLNTTYGPGRDRGMTSAPTQVMKSVVLGAANDSKRRCLMSYCGRENYHYVQDVGAHFAGVCMMPFDGFCVLNIKGQTIEIREFLTLIGSVAEELGMAKYVDTGISEDAVANLFVSDLDDTKIDTFFPGLPRTNLSDGIRQSILKFQQMADAGSLQLKS